MKSGFFLPLCARFPECPDFICGMRRTIHIAIALLCLLALAGCMKGLAPDYSDNDAPYEGEVTALFTIKQNAEGALYFQAGGQKLLPRDFNWAFVRQQRVMANVYVDAAMQDEYRTCSVYWVEPLDEGEFNCPDVAAGSVARASDGIDILLSSWITGVDDGYLTIHYNTWWGNVPVHHDFSLVCQDTENPYSLFLVQDSHGDGQDEQAEGIICFDINKLPDTGGETVKLTLNWIKLDGTPGTANFEFKSRE